MSIIRATAPKIIMAAAFATSVANPTLSQDMTALDALISGSSSDASLSQSDAVRDVIRAKIMELATQPSAPAPSQQRGAITIGEIDELNRTAERAKTDLELQKTSVERQRMELEGLLALYEALKIIEDGNEGAVDPLAQMMTANNPAQMPQGAQMNESSAEEMERASLPRIGAIIGTSGNFEAFLISPSGAREVLRAGDYSTSGFEIISMTDGRVVLKGDATGNEYNLRPQATPELVGNDGQGTQPNQAINLGGLPLNVF